MLFGFKEAPFKIGWKIMKNAKNYFEMFFRIAVVMFLLCVGSGRVSFVFAEETPSPVTLEELLEEALANNREIKEAKEEAAAAKARIPQASALPNPTAGTAYMGRMLETPLGPQKNVYEFEQMIPFPSKLRERHLLAKAEAQAASAQLKAKERDIIFRVSSTYYDLWANDMILRDVGEINELLKKFEAAAQSRYASQSGSQRDVAKAQSEVSEVLERVFLLRQQRQTLSALMNSLLNRNPHSALGPTAEIKPPRLSLTLEDLIALTKKDRPELAEASSMLKKYQHAKALAKLEYAPDLSIGFQYTEIGRGSVSDPNAGRDAWMIPFKITIPLWQDKIAAGVREAGHSLKASQANFEQANNLADYELRDAYYRFTTARQIVDLYQNAFIPQSELAFHSDQAGYEAGRVDILNFIDSERVYLNAKVAYYQALADALKSFSMLERAVGTDLKTKAGAP